VTVLTNIPATIYWLVSRQVEFLESDHREDSNSKDHVCVGFNGRWNKEPDTCYSFWGTASLDMLGQAELVNTESHRRFLLEKVQHRIGGFGKFPGAPPDIYHSYLALAVLGIMKEQGVKELDSALCVSIQAKNRIQTLRKA